MGSFKAVGMVCALLQVLAAGSSHAVSTPGNKTAGQDDAARCTGLMGKIVAADTVIQSADYLPQGVSIGTTKITVPFCRAIGVAVPTHDSRIGFEVWLPPAADWNGKFQGIGSGGSAGAISVPQMAGALNAGYATMSTDNGHLTDIKQKNGGSEQTWALGHPEKMVDFAYRALHLSTVAGKQVVKAYYGRPGFKTYFVACSQGGHHALMEATRYPFDYDGMVAGAPAWHWAHQMVNATWNSVAGLKDPSALTENSAALLNRAVIKACDKLDGVADGLISDPRHCQFDPAALLCSANSPTQDCLTQVQIDAANRIYQGAHKSDGTAIFQGFPRGSERDWWRIFAGQTPGGSSWDFWRYSVFQDPNFKNVNFDFDRDTDRGLNARHAGMTVAEIYNVKPDLSAYRARGGKIIIYHGWADNQVTPLASLDFHAHIKAREGQAGTDGFLRLFMMPGLGHCQGGPGPGNIGGASPALSHDPDHDVVAALDQWVTRHKAPDKLIATHLDENKKPDLTRPLCAFPREARYSGSGDIRKAENFTCRMPSNVTGKM